MGQHACEKKCKKCKKVGPTGPTGPAGSQGGHLSVANKNMPCLTTIADGDLACGLGLSEPNFGGGYVGVSVDGVAYSVGNGTKINVHAYFSSDGGTTAKTFAQILPGDRCYWQGTVAGFQLSANQRIDFLYLTP